MNKRSTSKTPRSSKARTDWTRVDALRDEDIDTSDIPQITPAQFAKALARKGLKPVGRKQQITLRIDADVLEWFKDQGAGYQTHINALLREYMKAHNSAD